MPYTPKQFVDDLNKALATRVDNKIANDPTEQTYRFAYQYGALIGSLPGTLSALNLSDEQLNILEARLAHLVEHIFE